MNDKDNEGGKEFFMPKINVHGLNMYYEFAGKGDPLVLVSGLGGDHFGWTETQVPAVAAAV